MAINFPIASSQFTEIGTQNQTATYQGDGLTTQEWIIDPSTYTNGVDMTTCAVNRTGFVAIGSGEIFNLQIRNSAGSIIRTIDQTFQSGNPNVAYVIQNISIPAGFGLYWEVNGSTNADIASVITTFTPKT